MSPANQRRLAKLRVLAERGATEGERNAARKAMQRIQASDPTHHDARAARWVMPSYYGAFSTTNIRSVVIS